jgi:hypothetical protein
MLHIFFPVGLYINNIYLVFSLISIFNTRYIENEDFFLKFFYMNLPQSRDRSRWFNRLTHVDFDFFYFFLSFIELFQSHI